MRQKHHELSGASVDPRRDVDMTRSAREAMDDRFTSSSKTETKGRSLDEVKLISPAMLEEDYPNALYITGVGYTETVDINRAILSAKEQVAGSVSSEIESEIVVELNGQSRHEQGRKVSSSSSSRQRQTTVQRVRFTRAELIEVDPKRTGCDDQRCVAVAFIRRQRLAQPLLDQFTPIAQQVDELLGHCKRAAQSGDAIAFAGHYAQLEEVFGRASQLGRSLEIILSSSGFTEMERLRKSGLDVQRQRDSLLSTSPIIIDLSELISPQKKIQLKRDYRSEDRSQQLSGLMTRIHREDLLSLSAKTLPYFGEGPPCEGAPPKALHLKFKGELSREDLGGAMLELFHYQGEVRSCASGKIIARFSIDLNFHIADNQTFIESAQEKLKSLSSKNRQAFYDALHLTLPLSRPSSP